MREFAFLFAQLDQTNKTNRKVALLKSYFQKAPDEDKLWVLALFTHKRPKRQIKVSKLREWTAQKAQLPNWLFEESYSIVGDLAETISLILPPPQNESHKSLAEWIEFLVDLAKFEEEEQKRLVMGALDSLNPQERFIFIKLMNGGFRVGVSQKLIVRGLSQAIGQDEASLAHRLMGNWQVKSTTFHELILKENPLDDISKPYPFCLAYALEDAKKDIEEPSRWLAEWKWDGIRGQIIVRKGEIFVWSRGEELVTDKFPEFQMFDYLPDGTVLDGEILAFKDNAPLPFSALQTRIGRKNITKKILQEAPVSFIAYDLLEHESKDLREMPFEKRRVILEQVHEANKAQVPPFRLSKLVSFSSTADLANAREQSREKSAEGLMLKRKDSVYHVGRKKGDWWKWKVDPLTIDAVMIYAQKGHGRRAGLYSDYTFAVWNGEQLVTFTKAYSGLTDAEMREVDAFVKRNTLERFGPVRTVKPELVFEIAFEGIQESKRHKSGVALRFPRILRWRKDKKAEEADTLENLKKLL